MKRQLSLVLALVMILGSFSSVFAAVSVDQSAVNVAGAFLKAEGVLEGDDGNLMLDANLKRRDAVVLISRLLGEEDEAKVFPSEDLKFTDITDDHYNGYIAWSVAKEIIEGHTGTTLFGFNEEVTAQQFSTMLLRVLGHEVNDEAYPKALELAEELGLLIDIEDAENTTVVKRGMMALMTFNALYVEVKGTGKTLAETLDIEMPEREVEKETELSAKVLDTENLAEIVVELSNADLVKSQDALLNPNNYRLAKTDANVEHVHLDGDNVILTLVPYGKVEDQGTVKPLIKGTKFDLVIRNIDPKINKTYAGIVAGDNAIPVVENVDFMGDYGIKVTTSEPIANPLERNFRLDSRTSMIVEQYGRHIILTPYHGKAFDKDATELTIDKLEDFSRYTTTKATHDMELSDDDALPKVVKTYRSGNKLVVHFDRDIYHDSVGKYENRRVLGNVSFVERKVAFYANTAEKVDTNVVEYTFEREIPRGVEVLVEEVANHFNKAMEADSRIPEEYRDENAPVVISSLNTSIASEGSQVRGTKTDSTKGLKIDFDKDIKELVDGDVDLDKHFTLYQIEVSTRGNVSKEVVMTHDASKLKKDSITLHFEDIYVNNKNRDYDYVLEIRNFSDLSGNRMEREYIDFQVVPKGTTFNVENISMKDARYFNRDGVEIKLVFTGYVDKATAEDATNYYLGTTLTNAGLRVSEAIVERDGITVTLVIYDTSVKKLTNTANDGHKTTLEISPRLQNLAKTATVANRFWNLVAADETETLINNIETLLAADPLDMDALKDAQEAYEGLDREEKALVPADLVDKLDKAIDKHDKKVELEDAKKDLEDAIEAAVLTEEEKTANTEESVKEVEKLIAAAVERAERVLNNKNSTAKDLSDAIDTLETKVASAKKKLVEKEVEEPEEPVGPTVKVKFTAALGAMGTYELSEWENLPEEAKQYSIGIIDGDGEAQESNIVALEEKTNNIFKNEKVTVNLFDEEGNKIAEIKDVVVE